MKFDRPLAIACAETIQGLYNGSLQPNVVATKTDTQVLVKKQADDSYLIAFPGTASVQDWLTDAKFQKEQWACGQVHRGFGLAYESVHAQIASLVPEGATVILTGHSLGGALATLCAEAFRTRQRIAQVITFGSPRVGNGAFARNYNDWLDHRTARVVNAGDPIPHVPWVFGTYRHVATQVYLQRDGSAQIDQPLAVALTELQGTLQVYQQPASPFASARQHHIGSYLVALKSTA